MNAVEAKKATYAVCPPVRPAQALFDKIETATKNGLRSVYQPGLITEQNQWWLEDAGYWFTFVDLPMGQTAVLHIHW